MAWSALSNIFTSIDGSEYELTIESGILFDPNPVININGTVILDYPKIKNITTMLRPSQLLMTFNVDVDDTWYLVFTETVGDAKFPVTLKRNGAQIWFGYVKVDGFIQSYVADRWVINLQAIDGLGYLQNKAFNNPTAIGTTGEIEYIPYEGMFNEIIIIAQVLKRTGNFNKGFIIWEFDLIFNKTGETTPPISSTDRKALENTFVNASNFRNDDNDNTVFDCKKVLEAILLKYGACIFQFEDRWHIMRVNSFWTGESVKSYKRYNFVGELVETVVDAPIGKILGSQVNLFNPHHAGANQQIEYDSTLGGYKVLYKYGFAGSILLNSGLLHDLQEIGSCPEWIGIDYSRITFWRPYETADGTKYRPRFDGLNDGNNEIFPPRQLILVSNSSETISKNLSLKITFKIFFEFAISNRNHKGKAIVRFDGFDGSVWWLAQSGEWINRTETGTLYVDTAFIEASTYSGGTNLTINTSYTTSQTPVDGTITVSLFNTQTWGGPETPFTTYFQFQDVEITAENLNIDAESHTTIRKINETSVIDDELEITVGDGTSDAYTSAIETIDDLNTINWYKIRFGGIVSIYGPQLLLEILSLDRMRMSGGNSQVFSGGIYGYLPYLGVLTIDNVKGLFMTISYSWDLRNNVITATHQRIFLSDNYVDLDYTYRLESDVVVKPTIEG